MEKGLKVRSMLMAISTSKEKQPLLEFSHVQHSQGQTQHPGSFIKYRSAQFSLHESPANDAEFLNEEKTGSNFSKTLHTPTNLVGALMFRNTIAQKSNKSDYSLPNATKKSSVQNHKELGIGTCKLVNLKSNRNVAGLKGEKTIQSQMREKDHASERKQIRKRSVCRNYQQIRKMWTSGVKGHRIRSPRRKRVSPTRRRLELVKKDSSITPWETLEEEF